MDVSNKLFGFYRAKVVNNKDPEKFGRVVVWVPQIMPDVEETRGLWALPANNPVGGRNLSNKANEEHYYMGSSFIPKIGSWVFVFFESGTPDNPYYFGSCDLENTQVLPENRVGTNYEDKWTLFKSHKGRAIVISDDESEDGDQRVEITGKKRQLKEKPTGDEKSVYQIDGNQTSILLDERPDKEKILIRTHKGDFIHIDIDEQNLHIKFENDINIDLIVQNVSEKNQASISVTIKNEDLSIAKKVLDELDQKHVEIDPDIAKISIVGAGMQTHPGVAARMFELLAERQINIEMISTSPIRISCVIREVNAREAVKVLHHGFDID